MPPSDKQIQRQEALLLRRHPELASLSFVQSALLDAPLDEAAALIANAWRRAYGDRVRIAWSPAYFRYCAGASDQPGMAVLAYADKTLQGVILGLPLSVSHNNAPGSAVLTTALCVSDAWQGKGLLEMLMLRYGMALRASGIAHSLHWRATKGNKGSDAGNNLAHAAAVPLYVKALHIRRAAQLGKLSTVQQLGLQLSNTAHGLLHWPLRLPPSMQMQPFSREHAESAAKLLAGAEAGKAFRWRIAPEQAAWNGLFHEDNIRARGWVLLEGGEVQAIAWGHYNPVQQNDAYFSLDRVAFSPALNRTIQKTFLLRIEQDLRGEDACFAMFMPGSVCTLPMQQLGWRPMKTYYLGATDTGCGPALEITDLAAFPMPLR